MLIPPRLKRTRKSPKPFPQQQSNPPAAASRPKVTKRAAKRPDLGPCAGATKQEVAADFKEMGLGHFVAAAKTLHRPCKRRTKEDSPGNPRYKVEKTPDYARTKLDELDPQPASENTALDGQENIVPAQLQTNHEHTSNLHSGERMPLTTKVLQPENKLIFVVSGLPLEIWAA